MKVRLKSPLFVLGKPTQTGKKDATAIYYYVTCSQGEDEAGKIRVADLDTWNRIEKYKEQLFTFEFNDQYNSFSIVDVEPMPTPDTGKAPDTQGTPTPDTGKAPDTQGTPTPDTGKAPDTQGTPTPDTGKASDAGKPDKKH